MTKAQDPLLNVARANLTGTVEAMSTTLQAAERLRNHQLEAIKRALAENETLIEKIQGARSFEDLVTVQLSIGNAQIKNIVSYWTGVGKTLQGHVAEAVRRALSENKATLATIQDTRSIEEFVAAQLSNANARFKNELSYWTGIHRTVHGHLAELTQCSQAHITDLQRNVAESLKDAWGGSGLLTEQETKPLNKADDSEPLTSTAGIRAASETPERKSA
jgi:hypothetical protein